MRKFGNSVIAILALATTVACSTSPAPIVAAPSTIEESLAPSRSVAATPGPALQIRSGPLDLENYKLDDEAATATLQKLLEESQTEHHNDFYQESRGAYLYRTYTDALNAAQSDERHPARKLSSDELIAVVNYSLNGFEPINKALWENDYGAQPDKVEHQIMGLLSALLKLPPYDKNMNKAFNVERGEFNGNAENYDAVAAQARYDSFIPGEVFENRGFWSTTRGQEAGARGHFLNYAMIVYKIKSKSGRSIERLSHRPDEEEVLFLPLRKFKVISKQKVPRTEMVAQYPLDFNYQIDLEEL